MERFVFVRCSWMKRYAGDADDEAVNGGSWVTEGKGPAGERYNFKLVRGKVYGRLQAQLSSGGFNLERIDAGTAGKKLLKGVCVVFVATPPQGGQRVVGWYRDGVVYAAEQDGAGRERGGEGWNMRGSASSSVLLPVADRTWEVPTEKGGMGTTQVRYPWTESGKPDLQPWMTAILKKIEAYHGPNELERKSEDDEVLDAVARGLARAGRQGFMADAAARRAVEMRAMRKAKAHFAKLGVVSDDHVGNPYDLSVLIDGKKRYVEVKGTTGGGDQVLLTVGEVNWARQHSAALFVLRDVKLARVDGKWKATGGKALVMDPWVPGDGDLRPMTYTYRVPHG